MKINKILLLLLIITLENQTIFRFKSLDVLDFLIITGISGNYLYRKNKKAKFNLEILRKGLSRVEPNKEYNLFQFASFLEDPSN